MCTISADAEEMSADWLKDSAEVARRILAQHPQFRGRADALEFAECDQVMLVYGQLPTFYLKQILQTVLRDMAGIRRIDNRVDVVSSDGLSSVRR